MENLINNLINTEESIKIDELINIVADNNAFFIKYDYDPDYIKTTFKVFANYKELFDYVTYDVKNLITESKLDGYYSDDFNQLYFFQKNSSTEIDVFNLNKHDRSIKYMVYNINDQNDLIDKIKNIKEKIDLEFTE